MVLKLLFKITINTYQYNFYEFLIVQTLKFRIPGTYHCVTAQGYKRQLSNWGVLFVHFYQPLADLLKSDGPQLP